MLVKVPVINDKTRQVLRLQSEKDFSAVEDKGDLDSVVSEVLNDKDIFMFLARHLPEGKGLRLGMSEYWDDTSVYVHHGLTLSLNVPRGTRLFAYATFHPMGLEPMDVGLFDHFPSHSHYRLAQWSSPEEFAQQVNVVLQNPRDYLRDLPREKGI